jgi:hypothetical protein
MVGKRDLPNVFKADPLPDGNVERGLRKPKFARFRDVVDAATAQHQKAKIKDQLTEGSGRLRLEKYRKSEEELKNIKSKQIRKFYETQNERLNAWLEVDTLVMTMAEDIFESMNPDRDGDGVAEQNGALQGVEGRLEELLPKEAREERRQGEKHARWAIKVCLTPHPTIPTIFNAGTRVDQRHRERASFGSEMHGSLLFVIIVFDSIAG